MSEYSFQAGALVRYYKCNGDTGQPAVVVTKEKPVEGQFDPNMNPIWHDHFYRIQLADGTQKVVFYRNLFPRSPLCDLDSHKIPIDVWTEIKLLDGANVQHRSGHRIGEVSEAFILERAKDELVELQESPGDIDEMADTMAILIHYCVRKGWTREQVDRAIIKKLGMRLGDGAIREEGK